MVVLLGDHVQASDSRNISAGSLGIGVGICLSYQLHSARVAIDAGLVDGHRSAVPRVVYWIGLTSLLTDISAEMIASTLPLFLFSVLALSPLQVGFLDGIYHGATALVRVFAGYWADTRAGNRSVAFFGYSLSALARIAILIGASFGAVFALSGLLMDRMGKGIRTAPRDALIAAHTPPALQGAAFGVHRTMDAFGAFAGPLIAAGLLWWQPMGYEWLIAVSLGFAIAGVLTFWLTVPEAQTGEATPSVPHASRNPSSLGLIAALRSVVAQRTFVRIVLLASLMSIFTISDGLIFASLQRAAAIDEHMVPLMFVGTALVFLLAAAPIGRLADRVGFVSTILGGYALLAACYFVFTAGSFVGFASPSVTLTGTILLLGLHYAATDGMLVAFAVRCLGAQVRTTGLAVLTTAIAVSRIVASTLYGFLWQHLSQAIAALVFATGMLICLLIAITLFNRGVFDSKRELSV
jgi:MFS family permease